MSSVLHSGLHALADPVVGASAASDERILPLVSSSQDKTLAASQERSPQRLHRLAAVRRREGITDAPSPGIWGSARGRCRPKSRNPPTSR